MSENYPGNSNQAKEDKTVAKPKVEKVISGTAIEKKETLGSRIRKSFAGDDSQSVGQYILFDVMIPAAKSMISDAVSGGIERLLFGTVRPAGRNAPRQGGYTSYGSVSSATPQTNRPAISARGRANHDFNEIVLETSAEAENVIQTLLNLVEDYGFASVADLYSAVGITGSYTDEKWGWSNLNGATYRRIRNGYLLELPRTMPAD